MKTPGARLLGVLALLALALPLRAQTTGAIRGEVETGGTPLPGVTVEARSPNLQGSRSAVTDGDGRFNLTLLPPGAYTVTATLDGFAPKAQTLQVGLNQAVVMRIEMIAGGDGRGDRDRAGRDRRDRVEHDRPQHGCRGVPGASDGAQLRLGRAARERHQHRQLRRAPDVDHGVRIDGPRERLHGGRSQHDRRRDRQPGQGPELRVHPGSGDQGRRLRGRVHRRPGRHPERRDQVRRQRVPWRRLRVLGRRRSPGGEQAPRRDHGRGHTRRLHAVGLRRRHRRLHPEGSPLVLRRLRPRRQHVPAPDHAGHRRGHDHGPRHDEQPLCGQADLDDQPFSHASSAPSSATRPTTSARSLRSSVRRRPTTGRSRSAARTSVPATRVRSVRTFS